MNETVEADIKGFFTDVTRLAGINSYMTSVEVADAFFTGEIKTVVIASGKGFPDGLAGGPAVTAFGAPLILIADSISDHAKQIFTDQKALRLVVMGGKGVISQKTAESIADPAKETE